MASTPHSLDTGLQRKTSGQICSGLILNKVSSTITLDKPSEGELDHLFKIVYDDYMGNQPYAQQTAPSTTFFAAPLP
ncbi:hypothetical protein Tco_0462147 [Tanacetum coccineum]